MPARGGMLHGYWPVCASVNHLQVCPMGSVHYDSINIVVGLTLWQGQASHDGSFVYTVLAVGKLAIDTVRG